jgi:pimeloyl-ACP methyl ester carboxylesterase
LPTILLIHGAATTSRVWRRVTPALTGCTVLAPDRPVTGELAAETAALAPLARGSVVAGVSGGATLGLALLMAGVPVTAAVLHEPAVGSLAPGLLDAVAAAHASGGVTAFATTLYGPAWTADEAPSDPDAVARDLAMFRGFEPQPLGAGHPPVLLTVGELSPPIRHASVSALGDLLGVPVAVIEGGRHAVHLEHPEAFAALLQAELRRPC